MRDWNFQHMHMYKLLLEPMKLLYFVKCQSHKQLLYILHNTNFIIFKL